MVTAYKKKGNYGLIAWIIVIIASTILSLNLLSVGQTFSPFIPLLSIAAYACIIFSIHNYAKAKGYSGWYGLLGFVSLLGLLIIALLKDKTNQSGSKTSKGMGTGVKILIGIAILFVILAVLGIFSSFLVAKIDPMKQLNNAILINCTNQCLAKGDKSNVCINNCVNIKMHQTLTK